MVCHRQQQRISIAPHLSPLWPACCAARQHMRLYIWAYAPPGMRTRHICNGRHQRRHQHTKPSRAYYLHNMRPWRAKKKADGKVADGRQLPRA